MSIDILLFALVAAFLVHRLHSVLGTRHGDERQRPNPFSSDSSKKEESNVHFIHDGHLGEGDDISSEKSKTVELDIEKVIGDGLIKKDKKLERALIEIAEADDSFDLYGFSSGAKMAFEIILESFAEGDLETLKPLLSQKLYEDFEKSILEREKKGINVEMELHEIKSMQLIDARLAGTMVYITVDFDVEETMITKDSKGKIIKSKSKDHKEMHDVWTYARDVRSEDPIWVLIETSAA